MLLFTFNHTIDIFFGEPQVIHIQQLKGCPINQYINKIRYNHDNFNDRLE